MMLRPVRVLVALALVAAALAVPSQGPAPAPPSVPPRAAAGSAMERARQLGRPVEDVALGSESRRVLANPDGTHSARLYARATRTRKDGGWVPIDTTLAVRADGKVAPVAAPVDLELSNGGPGSLARLRRDGREFALTWPHRLPRPVLAGDSATYPEVLPGVDLVVHASATGFSEVLVVKSAAAARQPGLARIRFGLDTAGLTVRTDASGTTAAVDERGEPVVTFGSAWMWDSAGGPDPVGPGGAPATGRDREPATGDRRQRMGLDVDRGGLTVVPDPAMLRDPRVTFPLYLDPQWPAGRQHWLMVAQDLPLYGWWDSAYDARVGRDPEDSATDRFRSYFQLDTSFLNDKLIKKAIVAFTEKWRYSCTPEPVYLWQAGPTIPGSTWSASPVLTTRIGSVSTPRTSEDCDVFELVEFDVRSLLTQAATSHAPSLSLALVSDETTGGNGGKVFDNNPFIDVEYNTLPYAPVPVGTAGVAGCSASTPTYVNRLSPELRVRLEDADAGQPTRATFEWREIGATTSRTLDSASRVPGEDAWVTASPPLVSGRTYEWRARAYNANTETDVDVGPFSGWCRFVVDDKPPATSPVVTRFCPAGCLPFQIDKPAQFTFSTGGDPDAAAFAYILGGKAAVRVPAVAGRATVTITPIATSASLQVFNVDAAGNQSKATSYSIRAEELPQPAAYWPVDPDYSGLLGDAQGAYPATLTGGYNWPEGQDGGTALGLDGAAGTGAHTAGPVVRTDASFTVMAWLWLGDDGDWRTALSQSADRFWGFNLRYEMSTHGWAFAMRASDADDAAESVVVSNTVAQVGVWAHVAGVYDHEAGELRLYVDGRLAGSAPHRSTWNATGPFVIGYRNYGGFQPSRWTGRVDEVKAFPFAASDRKVSEEMGAVGRWGPTGWWALDGDDLDSGYQQHTLARLGATSWTTRLAGADALRLDGAGGHAYTANPVVHTDGSFSVAAWVSLDRAADTAVAVSQDGALDAGFSLGYLKDVGWAFSKRRADSGDPAVPVDRATYAAPVQLGVWTHLAGVYDKTRRQLSLYVNGRLAATGTHDSTWDARGSLTIGRSRTNGRPEAFWPGGLDDVRVTGTAVSAVQVTEWMASPYPYGPQGRWDLDDTSGATRRDASGNGHTLFVAAGGSTTSGKRGSALRFTGASPAAAYTAGPVVPTITSFTAAAWVKLNRLDRPATAVSQDGLADSGFTLGYDAANQRWAFSMSQQDRADGTGAVSTVRATVAPTPGVWTHLAGTYDDKKHELKLYVDGELVGTTPHVSTWDATGPLVIGRGQLDGTAQAWWPGDIDEPRVANVPMSPEEIRALLVTTTLGPGAWWPMEPGVGAADASGNGYSLAVTGGTSWTTGHCGNALLLDGITGRATSPGPVLRTDQSFTVAAWVRLDAGGADAAALSQDGLLASSFYLGYNGQRDKWWFILPTEDSATPDDVVAFSTGAAQRGVWTHLAGVYDDDANQMRLYVNGQPVAVTAVSASWNAVGALQLGRAQWNRNPVDSWRGGIDDARALARAASSTDLQAIMAACPATP